MVAWRHGVSVTSSCRTGAEEMSTYTATIRWTRDRRTRLRQGPVQPRARMGVRRRRGGSGEPEPAHRPRALVGPARGRSRGGVRRLALVVPHAVLRRLRAARRVRRRCYVDEAEGVLEKRADGKMAMTRVTLRPRVTWGGDRARRSRIADLHHRAHEACFIANSGDDRGDGRAIAASSVPGKRDRQGRRPNSGLAPGIA